jgi:hypothetical protein
MNRKKIARIGSIVMILCLLLTIFIGAMSVKAAERLSTTATASAGAAPTPAASSTTGTTTQPPNNDIDGDGIPNNEDPDIDGDGIVNGLDPDIDGDGIPNAQDPNPAGTNAVDSTPPIVRHDLSIWQWAEGAGVLIVLGWLVALPILRRRKRR